MNYNKLRTTKSIESAVEYGGCEKSLTSDPYDVNVVLVSPITQQYIQILGHKYKKQGFKKKNNLWIQKINNFKSSKYERFVKINSK